MTKILLLHATLQGVPIFFKPALLTSKYGGFYGWKTFFDSGEAVFFPWGIIKPLTFFQQCSPQEYMHIYMQEKNLVQNKKSLQKLNDFILFHKPEIVICHSRGADYFLNYVNSFPLASSVKKIIFLMGATQRDFQIKNSDVIKQLKSKRVEWINFFCPWDLVLLFISLFLTRKIVAGLFGTSNPYVKNCFLPLRISSNPHMHIVNDKSFIKEALS